MAANSLAFFSMAAQFGFSGCGILCITSHLVVYAVWAIVVLSSHGMLPFKFLLQDLIIEGIYMDIIHGKLDQENQQLEVEYTIGRDIRPSSVAQMVSLLAEW